MNSLVSSFVGRSYEPASASGKSGKNESGTGRKSGRKANKKKNEESAKDVQDEEELEIAGEEFEVRLQTIFDEIKTDLEAGKKIPTDKYMEASFLALFAPESKRNINKMRHDIQVLDDKVIVNEEKIENLEAIADDHDEEIAALTKKVIELEVEQYSTKYIVKNLPIVTENGRKERNSATEETMNEMLALAGLNENHVDNVFRMYPRLNGKTRQQPKENAIPNVFVQFANKKSVTQFLSGLRDIKSSDKFKDIQCYLFCPPSLRKDWDQANLVGFNLRKSKKMLTRPTIQNCQVVLLGKMNPQDEFAKIDWKKEQI